MLHKKWKFFWELNGNEKVLTLNAETGEKEWQLPYEKQEFEHNEEMYKIETESWDCDDENISSLTQDKASDDKLSEASLTRDSSRISLTDTKIINKNCKKKKGELVVISEHKVYVSSYPKSSIISLLENISILDCSLNPGSLDHIGHLSFNASANIGTSLLCINCLASDSNSLKELEGTVVIKDNNSDSFSLNSLEDIFAYFNTSDSLFFNSSIAYSGVNNCKFKDLELDIISLTGLGLKKETSIFVSETNFIFYQPSCLYFSHMPCLILLPISIDCSVNPNSSSCFSFANISCFHISLLALDSMQDLTKADQFISENSFICSRVFSGIDSVIDTILSSNFYVNKQNNVEVFKSFGLKITEVYSSLQSGEEVGEGWNKIIRDLQDLIKKNLIKEVSKSKTDPNKKYRVIR